MDAKEKQQSIFTDKRLRRLTKEQLIDLVHILERRSERYEKQMAEFSYLAKERCRQCLTQEKS